MPGYMAFCTANLIEVKHATQKCMGTPEAADNDTMPAHHQPWGYQAVRIHTNAGAIKAASPFLPKQKAQ